MVEERGGMRGDDGRRGGEEGRVRGGSSGGWDGRRRKGRRGLRLYTPPRSDILVFGGHVLKGHIEVFGFSYVGLVTSKVPHSSAQVGVDPEGEKY